MSDVLLPDGLTTRPLSVSDAPSVYDVMAAQERHDLGRAEIELADIVGDWQRPSFTVEDATVGVFDGERLVAYGELTAADRSDAAVHPDHRGRGIGTWVASWIRDHARAGGSTIVGMPVPEGSAGDLLLTGLGYHVRWTSWILKLPAGSTVPARPLPTGYVVREARPDEYAALHDVLEDAFLEWSVRERETFADFSAGSIERPGFEPWHLRVVLDGDGAVVAVAFLILAADDDGGAPEAYIDRLATRRDQRGRGLAQALMVDTFAAARAGGADVCGLATDSRTGALGLYERVGMQVTSTWVHRATHLLPAGLTSRTLTMADAVGVHAIIAAEETLDLGRVTVDLDDVVGDWQGDVDLETTTVGVLDGDVLVGYAWLDGAHAYAGVVPGHRGRGIGRWLAQWSEGRLRSVGADTTTAQVLVDTPADRLLVRRGYVERFTAWDLELSAGAEVAPRPLPDGYVVRVAEEADREACWTVFEDAFLEWADRERRSLPDFGAALWGRPGFEPWNLRVVVDRTGAVVGAAFVTITDGDGYVHKLATRADQRGRGLATSLLADAFAAARAHGGGVSRLSTDTRAGARSLYESLGMVVESTWVNRSLGL